MDDREAALPAKRTASATSSKVRIGSTPSDVPASPKSLTSFPSFSPPPSRGPQKKRSSKGSRLASSQQSAPDDSPSRNRASTVSGALSSSIDGQVASKAASDDVPGNTQRKASSSLWKGATSLHKSLVASLTGTTVKSPAEETVFKELDWDASDPLDQASDEQIQRVIDRNGGPIPSLRQFSKDLSESNGRVAEERNRKLEIIDRNRSLREENDQLKIQLEEMQRKYKNVQNLFKRYVRPEHPGQIQIVDSPNGHYILDSTTGDMIESSKPLPRSLVASIKTQSSVSSLPAPESPSKPAVKLDAVSSLIQLAPRSRTVTRDERKLYGSISLPQRPDSLELRSPVSLENLPPALRGTSGPTDGTPVDRLGFFFTASRETRHQEALAFYPGGDSSETSSVNSFPLSDDGNDTPLERAESQDDSSSLNVGGGGTSAAELLSYAPVGPALRFVSTPEHGVRMFVDVSSPSTPTEGVVTMNADGFTQSAAAIAQASASGTLITPTKSAQNNNNNALDALLEKLNEAHDKQQERRMNDWNTFHIYLKTNIPKGLSRASSDYGMASISRLCSKGTVSPETLKKFNNLILSGIPVTLRREVWMERTGANTLVEPGRFRSLVADATIDGYIRHEISVDVERTMGNNVFFRHGIGKAKLQDVLVAYAHFNPTIGYSQGLNIIAGNLLLMLPSAEDAFWLLVAIIDNILPQEYYNQNGAISGATLDTDGKVLTSYAVDLLGSNLHKHLLIHSVDLIMFTPGWFISAFAACLSGEPLYRIWDVLFGFCDGRYIFCFALALLKINRRGLLSCTSSEELMLYLGGKMTAQAVSLDVLIKEALRMGNHVTTQDLEKRREMFA